MSLYAGYAGAVQSGCAKKRRWGLYRYLYDGEISRIVDTGSQDIAQDRAEELGKAALMEDFGLTKEGFEAEGSELVYVTLYQRPNGQRIWDLDWYIPAYVNSIEWSCCVRLDAQTGEILDCDAVTGGIG